VKTICGSLGTSLLATVFDLLVPQGVDDGRVGEGDGRGGEELPNDDEEQHEEEHLLHPGPLEHLVAVGGADPLPALLVVVAHVIEYHDGGAGADLGH
jgi:hypothetical protein